MGPCKTGGHGPPSVNAVTRRNRSEPGGNSRPRIEGRGSGRMGMAAQTMTKTPLTPAVTGHRPSPHNAATTPGARTAYGPAPGRAATSRPVRSHGPWEMAPAAPDRATPSPGHRGSNKAARAARARRPACRVRLAAWLPPRPGAWQCNSTNDPPASVRSLASAALTLSTSRPTLLTMSAKIVSSSAPGTSYFALAGMTIPARQRKSASLGLGQRLVAHLGLNRTRWPGAA